MNQIIKNSIVAGIVFFSWITRSQNQCIGFFENLTGNEEPFHLPELPEDYMPVPIVRQAVTFSCGANALQSVLFYWNVYDGGEMFLHELLGTTPRSGTNPKSIVKVARQFGLDAYMKEKTSINDLKEGLERGQTIILDIQAWPDKARPDIPWSDRWEDGHYVVMIGMDEWYTYFMDPSTPSGYTYLSKHELMQRWHDYEVIDGSIYRYHRLAIFLKGKEKLPSFPKPLTRLE